MTDYHYKNKTLQQGYSIIKELINDNTQINEIHFYKQTSTPTFNIEIALDKKKDGKNNGNNKR